MSWSVRWTLKESAIPAEIERLTRIFPEDPPERIEREARYETSRFYDTRPKAEDKIADLKRSGIVAEIRMDDSNQRPRYHWINPCLESFMPMEAEPAEIARLLDDGFAFSSGLSRSNKDLIQCIHAGMPVGVSVHAQLSERMRRTLIEYAWAGGKVFVDSGSFTAFTKGSIIDWQTVMGRYKELFYRVPKEQRHNLYFVAPDVIGDPDATDRLNRETYGMFQFVMEDGGNMIVPVQKSPGASIHPGDVDDFWPRLEFPHRFIVGIPFNKAAWSEDEVIEWLSRESNPDTRIHLLGGGPSKVRSLIARASALGLTYGSITGDAFHGAARDRKFQDRLNSDTQPVTPQREKVNGCSPPSSLNTENFQLKTPTMRSNLTPESDFPSSSNPQPTTPNPPPFSFFSYQRDDLARAAMHDGCIIGWDPGMGKTMAIFAMPFLKHSRFTLIIAPGGLHEQIMDEGRSKFGIEVTPIPDQAAALRLMRDGILPLPGKQDPCGSADSGTDPKFFITAYTWHGYNGADEWAGEEELSEVIRSRRLTILRRCVEFPDGPLATAMATAEWKPGDAGLTDWQVLSLPRNAPEARIRTALRTAAMLFHPNVHGGDSGFYWRWQRIHSAATTLLKLGTVAAEILVEETAADPAVKTATDALAAIEQGIGHEKEIETDASTPHRIKCVFTPTLASLVCGIFDCVICDEAVRIKSGTAYQAQGILRMASRSRYPLTGTPIKNKLQDLFFLASWVTGHTSGAIARWPYGNTVEDRGQFARDFGVVEENLTKAEQAQRKGKKAPPPKTTNQICNLHRLWKLLGCIVIRRRKDDVPDCDIVKKTIVPIHVMPGTEQKAVYQFHLHNPPPKRSILASIGAQLQNLRQAALNPCSLKLTHGGDKGRSKSPWTPKFAAILKLAAEKLSGGDQMVIFSPFQDFSTSLAACFRDAGVSHLVLDGNLTPAKRGSMVKRFKSGEVPILIAGIDSMGEGHNLDTCRYLVLPSLSWAFDSNTQAVDRIHRLSSKRDVTIYVMVTTGSIDARLCSIWQEKGDSSDLALDGRLTTVAREEIDLGSLLRDAVANFDPKAESLSEDEVAAHWRKDLLPALTTAGLAYASANPPAAAKPAPQSTIEPAKQKREAPPRPQPSTLNSQPPQKRLSLFEIMKNKRQSPSPDRELPSSPVTPPPAAAKPAPNIIPFPTTRRPFSMRKVDIAELLRRKP